MKIDLSDKRYSAYAHLSSVLAEWCIENNKWDDLVIDIRTTVLGDARTFAINDGIGGFDFDTDWYEGGELELLAVCPIDELGELKYKL